MIEKMSTSLNEEDESTLMQDDFEGTETDDDAKFLAMKTKAVEQR